MTPLLAFAGTPDSVGVPIAVLLGAAVVLASARVLYRHWRADPDQRSRAWRIAALLLAQPLCAALLYFALLPPTTRGEARTLVVATAGALPARIGAGQGGDARIALPEAPALPGIERVPDLATALRRHPGTARLRIVGDGLEARDRDAARGLDIAFDPDPLPRGLVELDAPAQAQVGAVFHVDGRANGLRGGVAELLDPGRQRVDRVALAQDGRFRLSGTARVAGAAGFLLRLRDSRQQTVEDIDVPLQVVAEPPPRILVLAGAPGPEVKFLRRWARDAGLPMHTRIDAGGGLQLGDAPIPLDAVSLRRFDAVVLDERAWSALGAAQREALTAALRDGLGVVLRVTAPLGAVERARLRALGFSVEGGGDAAEVRLDLPVQDADALRARVGPGTPDAPRDRDAALPEPPMLTRRTVRATAPDAVVMLRGRAGEPLSLWRSEGRGRIAVTALTDSYRLVLGGRGDLHAELWSQAVATVSRPRSGGVLSVDGEHRQGQRLSLCGVAGGTRVLTPGGAIRPVLVDPATGSARCAAFWPRESGWHRLASGPQSAWFHVRAADSAPGLHRNAVREATLRLVVQRAVPIAASTAAAPRSPGARWPWWLAWLLASGALWWFERSRLGRSTVGTPSP
ncbi:carboxypeptidase regulatory-like domain-containing protein [Cognatilysobacter tabacisoli]|uniref:carboxypeptidase regulatory-like domain-containing protein n=1 Tax=Cognatilysobacter tabacisoli TaxID=2315424 RepID=UPI000E6AF48E|nr:carboxypeptidase regulatory-like domain-containing protein [Lysobacter tabacisoli]